MPDHGLRERLASEAKVLRDAAWNGPAATMLDASHAISEMNNLLAAAWPQVRDAELAKKMLAAVMNPTPHIKTPLSHPDHPTVGHRFKAHDGCTYFCDSHDPSCGYWMTPWDPTTKDLDGKIPQRRNVSENAVGRTFHIIHTDEHGEHCAMQSADRGPPI